MPPDTPHPVLDPAGVPGDPLVLFHDWLAAAERAGIPLHNTMALATATPDGRPSVRLVLLKEADARGFVFYTNYVSRKARELDANPRAEVVFYWQPLDRQVRVEGRVERVSAGESDEYFRTRPRGSQLSAWASRQSEPVESRRILEERMAALETRHPGEVPRPSSWGGFRIVPDRVEFWLNQEDRLHDRVLYERRHDGSWSRTRLSP